MGWNLLYPNYVQEADEYSIPYVNRRQRGEGEWANSGFGLRSLSEEISSPASLTNENPKKHSPDQPTHSSPDVPDFAAKRR